MYHFICVSSSVNAHIDRSLVLLVNSMEMNMGMQVSLWSFDKKLLECIPKSGIPGPYGIVP